MDVTGLSEQLEDFYSDPEPALAQDWLKRNMRYPQPPCANIGTHVANTDKMPVLTQIAVGRYLQGRLLEIPSGEQAQKTGAIIAQWNESGREVDGLRSLLINLLCAPSARTTIALHESIEEMADRLLIDHLLNRSDHGRAKIQLLRQVFDLNDDGIGSLFYVGGKTVKGWTRNDALPYTQIDVMRSFLHGVFDLYAATEDISGCCTQAQHELKEARATGATMRFSYHHHEFAKRCHRFRRDALVHPLAAEAEAERDRTEKERASGDQRTKSGANSRSDGHELLELIA